MPNKKLNALHLFADMIERSDDMMSLAISLATIHAMSDVLISQILEIMDDGGNDEDEK